jgi:transposase
MLAGFDDLYDARRRPGPITEAGMLEPRPAQILRIGRSWQSTLAIEATRRIDEIFAIEREINGSVAEQRVALRHNRIRPLVGELEGWMRAERARK